MHAYFYIFNSIYLYITLFIAIYILLLLTLLLYAITILISATYIVNKAVNKAVNKISSLTVFYFWPAVYYCAFVDTSGLLLTGSAGLNLYHGCGLASIRLPRFVASV